jgi:4-diphosphocytidyl-2-C-methyl-D-erythritol kinase
MLIHPDDDLWTITVPAKLNLFLEVIGRRGDGYHDLDTVIIAISLTDRLRFHPLATDDLTLAMVPREGESYEPLAPEDGAWRIPTDASNLVLRALAALRQATGVRQGMRVELAKAIPAQAGLGGGSADAAAAIVGGFLAWGLPYDPLLAHRLAASLGSDINFFLEGKAAGGRGWAARCTGRGELVQPLSLVPPFHAVVIHPPQGCSTPKIFSRLAPVLSTFQPQPIDRMLAALERPTSGEIAMNLFNRLETAAAEDNPWLVQVPKLLKDGWRIDACCMTGSGSAMYFIVDSEDQAEAMAARIKERLQVRAYAVKGWNAPAIEQQISNIELR